MSGTQRMSVGFIGATDGMTDKQIVQLRWLLGQTEPTEVHHGDEVGADVQFHRIAVSLSIATVLHPSDDTTNRGFSEPFTRRFEPRKPSDRNQDIVKDSMILMIALKDSEIADHHSDEWDLVQKAREGESLIVLIFPDGTWELEKSYETSSEST